MANPLFSVAPPAGQPLPPNWQRQARQRATMAEAAYKHALENAWRGNGSAPNPMHDARLKPVEWRDIIGEK